MTHSIISKADGPSILSTPILQSKCYRYAEEVAGGQIIACKKVIQAANRFIGDLENQQYADYPWHFDIGRAYRPIDFIERFMKPSKGNYDRMELLPWQHFVEGNAYGWVDKKTKLRRFKESMVVVGRGNGKTTMLAGNAGYGVSKDGENGADIYILANAKEQSAILFNEVGISIKDSALLSKKFRTTNTAIYYDATNSKIQHRASDSKKLDGLNAHMGIFDEIHEYRDFKLINVIKRSANKRRQPLIWYITTLGTQLDGPLMYLYQLAANILSGTNTVKQSVADRFFAYIAEIDEGDEPDDSSNWVKANPSLGVLLDLQQLRDDWERAKMVPQERSDFINKQLNVFTAIDEMSFLEAATILKNNKVFPLEKLSGRTCYGGFDLSATEDFTSACLEFELDDSDFFALLHSWTTKKKMLADAEKIPWLEWQKAGHLTIVDGEFVDYNLVYEWFKGQSRIYEIMTIGYDPANAPFLVQKLQNSGLGAQAVRQGHITLNAPLKHIKELFLQGSIIHNNNPMFNWYLSNIKLAQDRNGNWLPTKQSRFRKIDGFAAFLDAHCEQIRNNPLQMDDDADSVITVISL